MPANLIKSLADKGKASKSELEKYWKEAKTAAKETYSESDDAFYGTVTKIFKNKVKKHLGITTESVMHFRDFLFIEKFIMGKGFIKSEETPEDDSVLKVKNADPILKKGIRNPPEFKGTHGEVVPDKTKKKLK